MDVPSTRDTNRSEIVRALASLDLATIRRYQKSEKKPDLSHLPGGTGLPVLGHFPRFFRGMHPWMNQQYAKFGPVFRFKLPLDESIILLGPEANRLVLQNQNKMFSNFLAWDVVFRNLFDNSLLIRDFEDHKVQRRILQQAFKRPAVEGHMEIMNPAIKAGIDRWQKGRTIRTFDNIKQLLLETGAEVFLGLAIGDQSKKLNQAFVDIVAGVADPFHIKEIWFSPYAKGLRARKYLFRFIKKNIEERRHSTGRDLFSNLCQIRDDDGNYLSDEDICNHLVFLLFAAHDTTTGALSAVLYALADNIQWQNQLRDEIRSLNKSKVEFDEIEHLEKTGWTLKEALRMYPILPVLPRRALQDFEFNGHHIPANTPIVVSPLFTHYMPEYWSNPLHFDPYRFSPERAEDKKDFFQYLPFGGGAHKCLGLHFAEVQAKIFLFHLLKNYQVSKSPKMRKYNYNTFPLTFPTDGLPLRLDRIY